MPHLLDLTGRTFGRLTVLKIAARNTGRNVDFLCRCSCGGKTTVPGDRLTSGKTKSCGCLKRDSVTRHGLATHPLYMVWYNMIRRCTDTSDIGWSNYGGRGIMVCDRWAGEDGLANFISDMPPRPKGKSLERRENSGPYSPENCYWATRSQQSRNMRTNRLIEHNGLKLCLSDWAHRSGLRPDTLAARIKAGWPMERALSPRS